MVSVRLTQILEGDFWPEPVRVLTVQSMGTRTKLELVGVRTHRFYASVLTNEDLATLHVTSPDQCDFQGRPEAVFLGLQAHRIRYAHQFDPLFAVSVSQVDPLPHQIEAVYHHIIRNPRIRFLLADDPGA